MKPILLALALAGPAAAQTLGAPPDTVPKAEFVFEERVTLGTALPVGETPYGNRNLVPITGGAVAGPKLSAKVLPFGWDWQLRPSDGCSLLAAEYFLQADDGTVIHVLNTSQSCESFNGRSLFRPVFEVPKASRYAWLNSGTFVAELRMDGAPSKAMPAAVRIRFYQIH